MIFCRTTYAGKDIGSLLTEFRKAKTLPEEFYPVLEWIKSDEKDEVVFLTQAGHNNINKLNLYTWLQRNTKYAGEYTHWNQTPVNILYEDEKQVTLKNDLSLIEMRRAHREIGLLMMPELLKEEYKNDIVQTNKKVINKYFNQISLISRALDKVLIYRSYFEDFYPESEKITKQEALEHHIHAFLQDIYVLREKILTYIDILRNDIKDKATNEKEIMIGFTVFKENIKKSFNSASGARNKHTHGMTSFTDYNLTVSTSLESILSSPMPDNWNKQVAEEILRKKITESFSKSKDEWVEKSHDISKNCVGITEHVFKMNKRFLSIVFEKDNIYSDKKESPF